jgi:hypothetical protein
MVSDTPVVEFHAGLWARGRSLWELTRTLLAVNETLSRQGVAEVKTVSSSRLVP